MCKLEAEFQEGVSEFQEGDSGYSASETACVI